MKVKFLILGIMASFAMSCSSSSEQKSIVPEQYQSENQQNMQSVCDFVKSCGHYFIATEDGDQPRVRPFGTINIFEGKLYIQTGHKKRIASQIQKNPKIEICAFNGTTDWMRVEATLVEDERVDAKASMLNAYPELKGMYNAEDSNTAVYFMTNATAYKHSFTTDSVEVLKF